MADDAKRPLSTAVSPLAHQGWFDFAYHQRVPVAALLEAMGRYLADIKSGDELPPGLAAVVTMAQDIADERRSRRRGTSDT